MNKPMFRRLCTLTILAVVTSASLVLVACDRDEPIRVYNAPANALPEVAQPTQIAWHAPPQFRLDPQQRPFTVAGYFIGEGDKQARLAITRMAGRMGSIEANLARWRRQVHLPEAGAPEREKQARGELRYGDKVVPVKIFMFKGLAKDEKPAENQIVATVTLGDVHWFVKMVGPAEAMTGYLDDFYQFLENTWVVKPGEDPHAGHDHGPPPSQNNDGHDHGQAEDNDDPHRQHDDNKNKAKDGDASTAPAATAEGSEGSVARDQ